MLPVIQSPAAVGAGASASRGSAKRSASGSDPILAHMAVKARRDHFRSTHHHPFAEAPDD
jgi:hypothetical protein